MVRVSCEEADSDPYFQKHNQLALAKNVSDVARVERSETRGF